MDDHPLHPVHRLRGQNSAYRLSLVGGSFFVISDTAPPCDRTRRLSTERVGSCPNFRIDTTEVTCLRPRLPPEMLGGQGATRGRQADTTQSHSADEITSESLGIGPWNLFGGWNLVMGKVAFQPPSLV